MQPVIKKQSSLPPSWDTFCTAISNSAPATGLVYNDAIGSLLIEEIRQKSMESTTHGAAHVTTSGKPRGALKSMTRVKSVLAVSQEILRRTLSAIIVAS